MLTRGFFGVGGWVHLGFYTTIFTGVLALAAGFLLLGFLWLTLDIARPTPDGVDEDERNRQLLILWLGIPIGVLAICAVVAIVAVVLGAVVYGGRLR